MAGLTWTKVLKNRREELDKTFPDSQKIVRSRLVPNVSKKKQAINKKLVLEKISVLDYDLAIGTFKNGMRVKTGDRTFHEDLIPKYASNTLPIILQENSSLPYPKRIVHHQDNEKFGNSVGVYPQSTSRVLNLNLENDATAHFVCGNKNCNQHVYFPIGILENYANAWNGLRSAFSEFSSGNEKDIREFILNSRRYIYNLLEKNSWDLKAALAADITKKFVPKQKILSSRVLSQEKDIEVLQKELFSQISHREEKIQAVNNYIKAFDKTLIANHFVENKNWLLGVEQVSDTHKAYNDLVILNPEKEWLQIPEDQRRSCLFWEEPKMKVRMSNLTNQFNISENKYKAYQKGVFKYGDSIFLNASPAKHPARMVVETPKIPYRTPALAFTEAFQNDPEFTNPEELSTFVKYCARLAADVYSLSFGDDESKTCYNVVRRISTEKDPINFLRTVFSKQYSTLYHDSVLVEYRKYLSLNPAFIMFLGLLQRRGKGFSQTVTKVRILENELNQEFPFNVKNKKLLKKLVCDLHAQGLLNLYRFNKKIFRIDRDDMAGVQFIVNRNKRIFEIFQEKEHGVFGTKWLEAAKKNEIQIHKMLDRGENEFDREEIRLYDFFRSSNSYLDSSNLYTRDHSKLLSKSFSLHFWYDYKKNSKDLNSWIKFIYDLDNDDLVCDPGGKIAGPSSKVRTRLIPNYKSSEEFNREYDEKIGDASIPRSEYKNYGLKPLHTIVELDPGSGRWKEYSPQEKEFECSLSLKRRIFEDRNDKLSKLEALLEEEQEYSCRHTRSELSQSYKKDGYPEENINEITFEGRLTKIDKSSQEKTQAYTPSQVVISSFRGLERFRELEITSLKEAKRLRTVDKKIGICSKTESGDYGIFVLTDQKEKLVCKVFNLLDITIKADINEQIFLLETFVSIASNHLCKAYEFINNKPLKNRFPEISSHDYYKELQEAEKEDNMEVPEFMKFGDDEEEEFERLLRIQKEHRFEGQGKDREELVCVKIQEVFLITDSAIATIMFDDELRERKEREADELLAEALKFKRDRHTKRCGVKEPMFGLKTLHNRLVGDNIHSVKMIGRSVFRAGGHPTCFTKALPYLWIQDSVLRMTADMLLRVLNVKRSLLVNMTDSFALSIVSLIQETYCVYNPLYSDKHRGNIPYNIPNVSTLRDFILVPLSSKNPNKIEFGELNLQRFKYNFVRFLRENALMMSARHEHRIGGNLNVCSGLLEEFKNQDSKIEKIFRKLQNLTTGINSSTSRIEKISHDILKLGQKNITETVLDIRKAPEKCLKNKLSTSKPVKCSGCDTVYTLKNGILMEKGDYRKPKYAVTEDTFDKLFLATERLKIFQNRPLIWESNTAYNARADVNSAKRLVVSAESKAQKLRPGERAIYRYLHKMPALETQYNQTFNIISEHLVGFFSKLKTGAGKKIESQETEDLVSSYFVSNHFEVFSRVLRSLSSSLDYLDLNEPVYVKELVLGIGIFRNKKMVFEDLSIRKYLMKFYGELFGRNNVLSLSDMAQKLYYNMLKLSAKHRWLIKCSNNFRRSKIEASWGFMSKPRNNCFSKKSLEYRDKKYAKKRDFFLMVNRYQWSCFLKRQTIIPHKLKDIVITILNKRL